LQFFCLQSDVSTSIFFHRKNQHSFIFLNAGLPICNLFECRVVSLYHFKKKPSRQRIFFASTMSEFRSQRSICQGPTSMSCCRRRLMWRTTAPPPSLSPRRLSGGPCACLPPRSPPSVQLAGNLSSTASHKISVFV